MQLQRTPLKRAHPWLARIVIPVFGKYARWFFRPQNPDYYFRNDKTGHWYLFARTHPSNIEIDFADDFWAKDKAYREQFLPWCQQLDNGRIAVPVKAKLHDLLCLQTDGKWIEFALHEDGWHVHSAAELTQWDHWLVVGGIILPD